MITIAAESNGTLESFCLYRQRQSDPLARPGHYDHHLLQCFIPIGKFQGVWLLTAMCLHWTFMSRDLARATHFVQMRCPSFSFLQIKVHFILWFRRAQMSGSTLGAIYFMTRYHWQCDQKFQAFEYLTSSKCFCPSQKAYFVPFLAQLWRHLFRRTTTLTRMERYAAWFKWQWL